MRSTLGQAQENAVLRPTSGLPSAAAVSPTAKEIPYDYVAKFKLEGRRGNRVQDVINISVEGAFVAVTIGYSFIPAELPDRRAELNFLKTQPATLQLLPQPTLTAVFASLPTPSIAQAYSNLINDIFIDPRMLLQCLLLWLCGIHFKYSIVDSATGRELQNLAIHNIAGLGEPTGDRPFRPLAKPMLFLPRSTIRIEVEEISEGFRPGSFPYAGGELFIVLHGYKILGYGTSLP
jgi:hypothetical protein